MWAEFSGNDFNPDKILKDNSQCTILKDNFKIPLTDSLPGSKDNQQEVSLKQGEIYFSNF